MDEILNAPIEHAIQITAQSFKKYLITIEFPSQGVTVCTGAPSPRSRQGDL